MPALHQTILLVDVADFTNPDRTHNHHRAVRAGLYNVLQDALAESGVEWNSCTYEDRGDGTMILLPATVPKLTLVDRFPDRLVAALLRYNELHATAAAVQLRVVLHFGEVDSDANGLVSPALNYAFRILDADAAKSALRASRCMVALIASDDFYRSVIFQNAVARPTAYRQIPVEVKNTSTSAWLRLSETGPPPNLPLALWQPAELAPLRARLSEITVAHLPTIMCRAAGRPVPAPAEDTAWAVFDELMDLNAGPDGVPPALYFLELLTEQLEDEARAEVADWVDAQLRRLRLEPAMRVRRKHAVPIEPKPLLHLMIAAEPDAIDPALYQLSYWRQDDPESWPPHRINAGETSEAHLRDAIDDLVVAAEEQWADQEIRVALEFLFPLPLFRVPVHRWFKESDSPTPRPLIADYPIVLRSLERMRMRHWHRPWRERWRSLHEDPSATRVYYCEQTDTAEPFDIDLTLSEEVWVAVVPSTEPERQPGRTELTVALQSGIPVLIWHSSATTSTELRMIIEELTEDGGLAELPTRTQAARKKTFLPYSARSNVNITQHLVLLWDDPTRTVVVGQPPIRALP